MFLTYFIDNGSFIGWDFTMIKFSHVYKNWEIYLSFYYNVHSVNKFVEFVCKSLQSHGLSILLLKWTALSNIRHIFVWTSNSGMIQVCCVGLLLKLFNNGVLFCSVMMMQLMHTPVSSYIYFLTLSAYVTNHVIHTAPSSENVDDQLATASLFKRSTDRERMVCTYHNQYNYMPGRLHWLGRLALDNFSKCYICYRQGIQFQKSILMVVEFGQCHPPGPPIVYFCRKWPCHQ
jgi:hypothetical protein